jgi:hypothetical protein
MTRSYTSGNVVLEFKSRTHRTGGHHLAESLGQGDIGPLPGAVIQIEPRHAKLLQHLDDVPQMGFVLLAGHFGAALGAGHLIAWLSHLVRHSVTATGADAVAAWPGRLGTAHTTRPATSAASGIASASASTSTTLEHLTHLPSSFTSTHAPFGARRRVTPFFPTAAGTSTTTAILPTRARPSQ